MAPGKKKKKPASNPARGFATTSQPSKVKATESGTEEPGDDASTEPVGISDYMKSGRQLSEHVISTSGKDAAASQDAQDVTKMSADQLEAHLEDAELQNLLETNVVRCNSEVKRQLSRLATERRQARSQSHHLSLFPWLDSLAVEEVMQAHGSAASVHSNAKPVQEYHTVLNNQKLLLDIWTLQRTLSALEFPNLDEVLTHVLKQALSDKVQSSNDTIFGLVEALDWYAMNCESQLLPDYNSVEKASTPSGYATPITINEPLVNPSPDQPADSFASEVVDESSEADTISGEDENDDPDLLTDRYLQIRTSLWKRGHRDASAKKQPVKTQSRSTGKLLEKLSQIERDLLFDKDLAESVWSLTVQDLEIEHFKALRAEKSTQQSNLEQRVVDTNGHKHSNINGESEAGADGDLFGDIFASEGTTSTDIEEVKQDIRLLDFGRWNGLAPRMLLQEVLKTIDASFRVKITNLSQSSHSMRKRLEIVGTKGIQPEKHSITAMPSEVQVVASPHQWLLSMETVAVSGSLSAESYISTLALFLVLATDHVDSRITNRLPGVWRNLFTDLNETRKSVINDHDKSELKEIRKLIHTTIEEMQSTQVARISLAVPDKRNDATTKKSVRRPDVSKLDPAAAQHQWQSRTSRPAFARMHEFRRQLPIYHSKDDIITAINQNPIVIISAETGSGKSTQTGSFILENELGAGRDCHILITQPRRISAISLARRVSEELGESRNDLGTNNSLIGYAIRLESKSSGATRLTFATTGVLLRMFESSPSLEQLDYLILDEVHERTMDLDLLFIALRRLQQKRPGLKIILMSATVNAKGFSDYFGGAPVLDIPGRTYPVEVQYLEDAIEATNDLRLPAQSGNFEVQEEQDQDHDTEQSPEEQKSTLGGLENYSKTTRSRLAKLDEYRIDYDLITKLAVAIATKPEYYKYSSAILIFMPGIAEIRRLYNMLSTTSPFTQKWIIHLLHSSFSTDELERAFTRPPPGHRKIVIATNIAETGITIPDVTAVIDTCKEKILRFDERRQLSKLTEGFISRSSARQRRGRAARVQDGLCFHLVTRYRHDNLLLEQQIPEMLRLSLQDAILRVKIWKMGSIEDTLAQAINPPSRKNILRAIDKLKDAGALTKTEQLTPLGNEIARLPLEVTLAKLAVLGAIFRCLDPVLTMISILTSKSPFLGSLHNKNIQIDAKRNFNRADSDLLTSLNAYEGWRRAKIAGLAFEYCRKNHLSDQNLMAIEDQKVQLLVYLVDAGLVDLKSDEKTALGKARVNSSNFQKKGFYNVPERYNTKVSDDMLLCIIAMAFYPRVLVREGKGWRNVYTNQHISLTSSSVNYGSVTTNPPKWLSFYEAMQTKSGNLNVFETSAIPEVALTVLLGDAEVKMYSGVISLDNDKVRLAVRSWRQTLAIKVLRKAVRDVLRRCYERPGEPLSADDQHWIDIVLKMTSMGNRASKSLLITSSDV